MRLFYLCAFILVLGDTQSLDDDDKVEDMNVEVMDRDGKKAEVYGNEDVKQAVVVNNLYHGQSRSVYFL